MQAHSLSFTHLLMFEDGEEEFDGFKLNQFAMHQTVDDVAVFVLRPPLRTTYRLIIYARDSDLEVTPHLTRMTSSQSPLSSISSSVTFHRCFLP